MSRFDEEPDAPLHGECAAEIERLTAGMAAFALCSLTIASLGQPMMYYVILALGCPAVGLLCAYVGQEDEE